MQVSELWLRFKLCHVLPLHPLNKTELNPIHNKYKLTHNLPIRIRHTFSSIGAIPALYSLSRSSGKIPVIFSLFVVIMSP